jgi:chromatin remodeling complex protein RSC6
LIHTKIHNMLSYKKLHKLVYVNYNHHIRLRQADMYKREEDLFDKLIELSLYDAQNPIRDWMEHGRSNEAPLLDEEDTQSDTLMPSRIVTERDDVRSLQKIICKTYLIEWADETVGDTHIGKRK